MSGLRRNTHNPKVDKSSERSEESVLYTRCFFNKTNGFIVREENPDYGVDLDVELIYEKSASRKKFAIQIKSSKQFKRKVLNNNSYIVLDFLTSRLGYLSRDLGLGLIVVYEAGNNIAYYEYIENIIKQVDAFNKNKSWRNQEKVRIYIPEQNVLSNEKVKLLFSNFKQRHDKLEALINTHGSKFNIPFVNITGKKYFSEEDIIVMLEDNGLLLYDNLMFEELFNTLSNIPHNRITSSPKLCLLAALVYSKIGKAIDSNSYLEYCIRDKNTMLEFNDMIAFTKFCNDFLLGTDDIDTFISRLENIKKKSTQEKWILTLKINISLLQLHKKIGERKIDKSLESAFLSIFEDIEKSKLSEKEKHLFNLFHVPAFQEFVLKIISEAILKEKLKETLGVNISRNERKKNVIRFIELLNTPIKYIQSASEFSKKNDDILIKAHALHEFANCMFGAIFNFTIHNYRLQDNENVDLDNLAHAFSYCIDAHELFIKLSLFNNAYLCLTLAYEVNNFTLHFFNRTKGFCDDLKLIEKIRNFEKELGKKEFQSVVDDYFKNRNAKFNSQTKLTELSDENILFLAESILDANNLPSSRLDNLVMEMRNRRFFEKYCDIEKYELLQTGTEGSNMYLYPTSYKIFDKKNNLIIGKPSTDLEKLLLNIGLLPSDYIF